VVPAVSTLLMLVVLVGLGTWQIYRLHWKEGILEQIAMAESGPALPLTQNPVPFAKVSVSGRFLFDHAARFGAEVRDTRAGPTMGYQQIVPLQRDDGPPVLVDRGWVPLDRETPLDQPAGPVTVTGYIRPRETQHWFSPPDDAAAAQFYTLDPSAIGPALGIHNPAPFTLVALGKAASGVYPAPAQTLPRPPNNHLSYVITWYGLAVSLLVIFGIWLRKALRS
jgi:surfeit locus 1 family protein